MSSTARMTRGDTRRVMHFLAQAGVTAADVAADLGMPLSHINQWADGSRTPTPQQAERLLNLLQNHPGDSQLLASAADLICTAGRHQQQRAARKAAAQRHMTRIAGTDPFALVGAGDDMPF